MSRIRLRAILLLLSAALAPASAGCDDSDQPTPAPPQAPRRTTIRVVTLNALFCRVASVEQVSAALARHDPDLVMLQEVRPGQAGEIARALGLHRADTDALLAKGERLETALLGRESLREVALLRESGRPFAVLATTTLGGRELCVTSVHQTSTHIERGIEHIVESMNNRHDETSALLAAIADRPGPMIVGGDFNEQIDSPSLARLLGRFEHSFSRAGHGSPVTFPGVEGGIQIDHIFHSRRLASVDCFVDPAELSDHRMVVAELRWQPTPATGEPADE